MEEILINEQVGSESKQPQYDSFDQFKIYTIPKGKRSLQIMGKKANHFARQHLEAITRNEQTMVTIYASQQGNMPVMCMIRQQIKH